MILGNREASISAQPLAVVEDLVRGTQAVGKLVKCRSGRRFAEWPQGARCPHDTCAVHHEGPLQAMLLHVSGRYP